MHDPKSVAFEIYLGSKKTRSGQYKSPIITVWHNDPETDGTDDSCGWFIKSRHMDKKMLDAVIKEFEGEWDRTHTGGDGYVYNCGWFSREGDNVLSVYGIVFNMYLYAAKIVLGWNKDIDPGTMWRVAYKFMEKHYMEIAYFSENNRDSMRDVIVRKFERGTNTKYTPDARKEMIRNCATIISTDILRKTRRWYQHPRWHIRHWSIQFHPIQKIKRRYWDKCCVCGKRGFKESAISDWYGTKMWHQSCDQTNKIPTQNGD
jgi:hypothetical protein